MVANFDQEPDPLAILRSVDWSADEPPVRITVGWDTLLWRFVSSGTPYALRLYRREADPARLEAAAGHEATAMAGARKAGLPVPRIEARGSFEGVPFFVLEWRGGERMLAHGRKRPWRIARLGFNFGRAQARLHTAVPPPGLRCNGHDWIEENVGHNALARRITAGGDFTTLCHLDFHPLNVLVRGTRISGVLDFRNAALCDRRADLAVTKTTLLVVPLPHDWKRPIFDGVRKLVAREWEKGYRAEAGDFPLNPDYEALGICHYVREVERAVAEGRGWAREQDMGPLRAYRAARLRDVGLDETG